jgi:hypothetical protein
MAIPSIKDPFTGEVYDIPSEINYPTVVPEGFYNKFAQQRPVNSAAMAQQAMVDMLPLLSGMYGSANTEKSAGTVAGIIQQMISGYSKAQGAEGDITNQVQRNQNAADILGMAGQSKNPIELAMLMAAGKTFGGTEIPKEAITYGTVSPTTQIEAAINAAKTNVGSSAHFADYNAKMAQVAAANEANANQAEYNRQNAEIEATKNMAKVWELIGSGLDENEKSRLFEANLPYMQKSMVRFPDVAVPYFIRNYETNMKGKEPIENVVGRAMGITPDKAKIIIDRYKGVTSSGKQSQSSATPTSNTSNPSNKIDINAIIDAARQAGFQM